MTKFSDFCKTEEDPVRLYDKANSLAQGARNEAGNHFNALVAYGFDYFFKPWALKTEQKIRVGGKRDVDQVVCMSKGDIYVSATTTPQERKDGTWAQEYSQIVAFRSVNGLHSDFQFLGVFGENKPSCSLAASIKKRETLQLLMPQGVQVLCLHDQDHVASTLSSLLQRFV